MRLPITRRRGADGVNMTPMIDVVFQLLIFFLLTTHLSRQEVSAELVLPKAQSGDEAEEDQTPRVTVNVLSDGQVQLGNQAVAIPELTARLRVENLKHNARLEVRIRADRSVPYQFVEPVLTASAEAGIWDVKFAVVKEKQN
jgi:biopolymer transport protein ExbD